jgi:uncharacterized protein (TIGR03085 family)
MVNWAQYERAALCDHFAEVGPDAPTLCGDWRTRDLAAHLVLRERRPDAAIGIVVSFGPLAGHTARVQRALAARPWSELVALVRSGPPVWSPIRPAAVDRLANTVEYFVHHEDVRRASPGWSPRALDPDEQTALAAPLSRAKLLVRRSPVGLRLERPDGTVAGSKAGPRTVTVRGEPGELLLFAWGRQANSAVTYEGAEADIAAVRTASFGL